MRSRLLLRFDFAEKLIFVLLTVLLIGCGNNSGVTSQGTATSIVNKASGTTNGTYPLPKIFDIPGLLHIQGEIDCSPKILSKTIVLAKDRLTYDSGEIQQMLAHLNDPYHTPLPDTLQLVPGGFIGDSSQNAFIDGCYGLGQLTNIGQTDVQISQLNIRLTKDTYSNNYHYRLINLCSMGSDRPADNPYTCIPNGGGGTLNIFEFSLGKGSKNAIFKGQFSGQNGNAPVGPTIAPGQEVTIVMEFMPSVSPGNLVYSLIPDLTLDTSGEQRVIELPQLATTIAFANANQFSCYDLQGNTFVPVEATELPPNKVCL